MTRTITWAQRIAVPLLVPRHRVAGSALVVSPRQYCSEHRHACPIWAMSAAMQRHKTWNCGGAIPFSRLDCPDVVLSKRLGQARRSISPWGGGHSFR